MVQRKRRRLAAMKNAPIKLLREEFVSDMVPKSRDAVTKGVPNRYRKEEFVRGMVKKVSYSQSRRKYSKVPYIIRSNGENF